MEPKPPLCGEPIDAPSPRCSLPRGHAGQHETVMVPHELAPLAAAMVTDWDRHDIERAEFIAHRQRWNDRRRALQAALLAGILADVMLAILLILKLSYG